MSTGLYFDRPNGADSGFQIYTRAFEHLRQGATGVGGTFELDKQSWWERNVWGKPAIAVAVRQSREPDPVMLSERAFQKEYADLCARGAGLGKEVCALFGGPAIPNAEWLERYKSELDPRVLRKSVCDAVTGPAGGHDMSSAGEARGFRVMRPGERTSGAADREKRRRMALLFHLKTEAEKEDS